MMSKLMTAHRPVVPPRLERLDLGAVEDVGFQRLHPLWRFLADRRGDEVRRDQHHLVQDREGVVGRLLGDAEKLILKPLPRSEERRVGKECRSRWSPYH